MIHRRLNAVTSLLGESAFVQIIGYIHTSQCGLCARYNTSECSSSHNHTMPLQWSYENNDLHTYYVEYKVMEFWTLEFRICVRYSVRYSVV